MVNRIALVDDHQLFREGLRALLTTQPEMQVVGEAGDARAALDMIRAKTPDLAVIDISLPGTTGIALAQDIVRAVPRCKILMLTMHSGEPFVMQALDVGVRGYALKDQPAEEILDAIRTVARGDTYVAPRIPQWLVERHSRKKRGEKLPGDPIEELSSREREVFDLVVRGFTNEAIGRELSISVKTVETHRARINRKLGVHSPGGLIRFAALRGLVSAE